MPSSPGRPIAELSTLRARTLKRSLPGPIKLLDRAPEKLGSRLLQLFQPCPLGLESLLSGQGLFRVLHNGFDKITTAQNALVAFAKGQILAKALDHRPAAQGLWIGNEAGASSLS